MKVTLIHNPSAGERSDADDLVALIKAAGHRVTYQSSKEKKWKSVLKKRADLVAVAGGDGTVSKVARSLLQKHIPIAVLPKGTANNLAHMLEVMDTPLPDLVAGWPTAQHRPFDVGVATGPWGEEHFLESIGAGFFARAICVAEDDKSNNGSKKVKTALRDARRSLRKQLRQYRPNVLQVKLDGRALSGEFLMLEAMNIRSIGPNLHLAPEADAGDGLLDVVLISAEERNQLKEQLRDEPHARRKPAVLPSCRTKTVQIQGEIGELHVDDRPVSIKPKPRKAFSIDVDVNPGALVFLVPKNG